MKTGFLAAAMLSIAGCASGPSVETVSTGAPITAGSHYRWFKVEGEQAQLSEQSRTRLADALAARGILEAGAGKADYLLMVNHARRPAETGLAASAEAPPPGQAPAWLAAPGKRGKQLSTLQLHFLDPDTGREIGALGAHVRHGRKHNDGALDMLIEGLFAPVS